MARKRQEAPESTPDGDAQEGAPDYAEAAERAAQGPETAPAPPTLDGGALVDAMNGLVHRIGRLERKLDDKSQPPPPPPPAADAGPVSRFLRWLNT